MKTLQLIAFLLVSFSVYTQAADLAVAENGAGGAYSSITDAYNAATNGDRIIIMPQSGNAPYVENLSISKSLQFLSGAEGQQYTMQGTITIVPAAGREITFIGLRNLTGNITASVSSPAGARTKVNIINCSFLGGNISFDYDYFDINLASTTVVGQVVFRYGRAIGNDIDGSALLYTFALQVNNDALASNDSILIIGNKIKVPGEYYLGGYQGTGISWNSTAQFFSMLNNYIYTPNPGYANNYSISINQVKASVTGTNTIVNNTLQANGPMGYGIYFGTTTGALNVVRNNVLKASAITTIISGAVGASFNYATSGTFTGLVNDGTNNLTANITLDVDGRLLAGSDAINGGDADSSYYDINLTRNDAGAYGGSFTLDNFFPITGAARVYFLNAPRRVTVGNTIGIKADGFDR
jgi:hypothetical protein